MVFRLQRRSARISQAHVRRDRRLRRGRGAARHPLRIALRAPPRSGHRPRAYRLSAAQPRRRHFKAGAAGRGLCAPPADPGKDDGRDRVLSRCRAQAPWRRRRHRSHASMHDDARCAQARRHHGDEPDGRGVPQQCRDASGIFVGDRHARSHPAAMVRDRTLRGRRRFSGRVLDPCPCTCLLCGRR